MYRAGRVLPIALRLSSHRRRFAREHGGCGLSGGETDRRGRDVRGGEAIGDNSRCGEATDDDRARVGVGNNNEGSAIVSGGRDAKDATSV